MINDKAGKAVYIIEHKNKRAKIWRIWEEGGFFLYKKDAKIEAKDWWGVDGWNSDYRVVPYKGKRK